MNSVDRRLVNKLQEIISNEIHDNYHYWVSWASQMPEELPQDVEPSSEGLAFIVDYMVEQINNGHTVFLDDLDQEARHYDFYDETVRQWMGDRFGAITYTNSGDLWMSREQADIFFGLYEQAIKNISKREITRGI